MKQIITGGLLWAMVFAVPVAGAGQNTSAPASHGHDFAPVAQGERIENLDVLKHEVSQYHACTCTCGCYAKDLDGQADRAIAYLRQRVSHRAPREKMAIVLDIDETALSNYQQMQRVGFAYDKKAFDAWIDSAAAPAIPGTLRLYKEAERLKVSVFFLTGRPETQRAATEQNLKGQGFEGWQGLILRSPAEASLTAQAYKSAERAAIQSKGYRIVLNVGDQWSDLRGTAEADYSVKYPDPYYFIR